MYAAALRGYGAHDQEVRAPRRPVRGLRRHIAAHQLVCVFCAYGEVPSALLDADFGVHAGIPPGNWMEMLEKPDADGRTTVRAVEGWAMVERAGLEAVLAAIRAIRSAAADADVVPKAAKARVKRAVKLDRVVAYIEAHPGRSWQTIAEDCRVSLSTVARAYRKLHGG
jgi:hypothetical protein